MSSLLGHRLFARLSPHTTDWRHIGTVEAHEPTLDLVSVAMRDGAREFLLQFNYELTEASGDALRFSLGLVEASPLLKLEPADNFCLDAPMGPSVGSYHDRPTQVIDSPR